MDHFSESSKIKRNIHLISRGIILQNQHILLAYDPRPKPFHYYALGEHFYYLPGGHIEPNESSSNALQRELYEETGHQSTIGNFLEEIEYAWGFPGDEVCCHPHEINFIYTANLLNITSHKAIQQKEDHVAFKWSSVKTLNDIDLRPLPLKLKLLKWVDNSSLIF